MKRLFLWTGGALCAALSIVSTTSAAPLLQMNDFIIAIDADAPATTTSSYPAGEAPAFAFDENSLGNTKYLNFGEEHSGVIVSPFGGPFTLRALKLTTANDAVERDPTSYKIWGTNDAIVTADNAIGPNSENWSLIGEGALVPPDARHTDYPVVPFAGNNTAYASYRITFPTVRNAATANSMQVNEIRLYEDVDALGANFAVNPSLARAILLEPVIAYNSNYPAAENPKNLLDGFGPNPLLPSQSTYPTTPNYEGPANLLDADPNTKYFNGGNDDVGFIVTPDSVATTVRSFKLTTANDAPERDPTSWQLYGTNEPIASADNSYGTGEAWTLIDSGAIALPTDRFTMGTPVAVNNNAGFLSYKMVFPTRVAAPGGGGFQLGDASFYSTSDGTGADLLGVGDPILAIDATARTGESTKYLNFGKNNSGFIVTPSAGPSTVTSFQITTANDHEERDPLTYELYGTNDAIASLDNQQGTGETWTPITSGTLELPVDRFTQGAVVEFANATQYTSYKMVFPTVKDNLEVANSMQIAGVQFFGEAAGGGPGDFSGNGTVGAEDLTIWKNAYGSTAAGDANGDGKTDGADFLIWQRNYDGAGAAAATGAVPEPASALLALGGAALALACTRRRVR